jgi:hypothetical protein
VQERLQETFAVAVRPARIRHAPQHRGPAAAIGTEPIRSGAAGLVGVAVDLAGRGSARLADLAVLREPRRLEEAPLLVGQQHVPAIGQAIVASEIDAPLGDVRHLPVERDDLIGVRAADVDRVPHAWAFEDRDPDLAPLLAEFDLRAGDGTCVAFAREGHAHILVAVLEDAHDDRVLFAGEVQQEVLAGKLDFIDRHLASVKENVIREKVRQHREPARAFDT